MVPSSRTPLRPDRLRALNLPSAVEVRIDEWGQPVWVVESNGDSAGRRAGGPAGGGEEDEGRKVEEVVETWIVQDEWWRAPINRRYVEVVLEGGAHVVLFEDLTTGDWFLQKP
jgi:hypothetical protein